MAKESKAILMSEFTERYEEWEEEGKLPYLPVEELKPLHLYRLHARNASWGIWHPKRKVFVISRFKFKDNYLCSEVHWDLSSHFGTAKPLKDLGETPITLKDLDNKESEVLEYLNTFDPDYRCMECGRYKNEWIRHEKWCKNKGL